MSEKTYLFRREDTGEIVEVPWATMIEQQGGWITIDGVPSRRCIHLEIERDGKPQRQAEKRSEGANTIFSDALGFPQQSFSEFEEDRQRNGFSGVEFTRDPQVPEFYQVKCATRAEFNRYMKHRGYVQKSGIGGVRLTQDDLDRAKEMVERGHVST